MYGSYQYTYIIPYAEVKINTLFEISMKNYTIFNFFGENNKSLSGFLSIFFTVDPV